ncbi:UDP-glucuronosyltransferase 1A9-like [Physella acuta]|uniref:UDP-glucuronosyltransferase 1A9-like n=1 Tax=Physella acuta TaxID=109671 RepID=UPI0027DC9079|nr:UDP-glucuronosyltransferase 1A9-like [Physella acuta]
MSALTIASLYLSAVILLTQAAGKRVVMLPGITKSYFIYNANIGQALIDLGHEVWMFMPEYLSNSSLVKFKDIKIVTFGETLGNIEKQIFEDTKIFSDFWEGKETSLSQHLTTARSCRNFINKVLADEKFMNNIKILKPEFLVIDKHQFIRNIFVIPYKLDVPFAVVGTVHDLVTHRVPFSPAVEPRVADRVSNYMGFYDRLTSTLLTVLDLSYDIFSDRDIVSRIAPEKPYTTISDIILKAEIFIAELDHILDYPRPMLPNTKLIGGSSVCEPRPLIGVFKKFVDESANGIVLVSFGSNELPFPEHILAKLTSAFENLEFNVIWRVSITSPAPKRILTSEWIPQNDLLGHTKTKVFVSHCGKTASTRHYIMPCLSSAYLCLATSFTTL